jgi:hypothetical protein
MKTLLATLFAFFVLITPATSQEFNFGTGVAGGGYDQFSRNLVPRFAAVGVDITIQNFEGSNEITRRACEGEVQIFVAQWDAFYARALEGCQLTALADYAGGRAEYGWFLTPPGSRIRNITDLSAESKVAVDGVNSGSELTFRTMQSIRKTAGRGFFSSASWEEAQTVNVPVAGMTVSARTGMVDAAFIVRLPNSQDLQTLLVNGWTLHEFRDSEVEKLLFNGQPLYPNETVRYRDHENRERSRRTFRVQAFVGVTATIANDMNTFVRLQRALN